MVDYLPAKSNTGMFGGNSNWRGLVWMPVNALLIRDLLNFYGYYGDIYEDSQTHHRDQNSGRKRPDLQSEELETPLEGASRCSQGAAARDRQCRRLLTTSPGVG